MRKSFKWTLEKRKMLKQYLEDGYSQKKVCTLLRAFEEFENLTEVKLNIEVKKGLSEEDQKDRRFSKYSIVKVYENIIGADAIEYLRQEFKNEK